MATLVEIQNLQNDIRELQSRLERVRLGLDSIEQEVDFLSSKIVRLERDMKYMKKDNVITLASEYGRTKTELEKINRRLSFVKADRENHRAAFANIDLEILRLKGALWSRTQAQENNVIYGPFYRRPGYDG